MAAIHENIAAKAGQNNHRDGSRHRDRVGGSAKLGTMPAVVLREFVARALDFHTKGMSFYILPEGYQRTEGTLDTSREGHKCIA